MTEAQGITKEEREILRGLISAGHCPEDCMNDLRRCLAALSRAEALLEVALPYTRSAVFNFNVYHKLCAFLSKSEGGEQ